MALSFYLRFRGESDLEEEEDEEDRDLERERDSLELEDTEECLLLLFLEFFFFFDFLSFLLFFFAEEPSTFSISFLTVLISGSMMTGWGISSERPSWSIPNLLKSY